VRRTVLALLGGSLAAVFPSPATAVTTTSSNWAGYVVSRSHSARARFRNASGTWTVPSVTCSTGRAKYSAVWVGLGGYRTGSSALEQIGTDADCSRSGRASYSSWVELLPAAPVDLQVKVHPGDVMSASVTVFARHATLRIRDLSSGERTSITRRLRRVDTSSAEWIVEAPSVCTGSCHALPLSDFGEVVFSAATATVADHTGTIEDARWGLTELQLRQRGRDQARASPSSLMGPLVLATPTTAAAATGAFSVTWSEQAIEAPPSPSGGTV
jgi:hypothetical protein